jgi:hypothetical protein
MKKLYICLMIVLCSIKGFSQFSEYGGTYYDNQSGQTGVIITYNSNPNLSNPGAQMDAQMAANAAAAASHVPVQPVIPPPTGGISCSSPPKPTAPLPKPKPDPCAEAKSASVSTTAISKDANFTSAKNSIATASTADGLEHGITLGRNSSGQITQAPMKTGGAVNVPVNTSWPGAFAALHNHPNSTPLSSGDIYSSVTLNVKNSNFTTSFVLINGETYAIAVTNLVAAHAFVATYPADQSPGYSPEFPDFIFDQIVDVRAKMGESIEARTGAIAFVLDKYNAGITLLKQNSSGEFKPIKTQEATSSDGSKTYTSIPCN